MVLVARGLDLRGKKSQPHDSSVLHMQSRLDACCLRLVRTVSSATAGCYHIDHIGAGSCDANVLVVFQLAVFEDTVTLDRSAV